MEVVGTGDRHPVDAGDGCGVDHDGRTADASVLESRAAAGTGDLQRGRDSVNQRTLGDVDHVIATRQV